MINFFWLLLFSYLLGSIPFGLVVSRVLGGPDPRTLGSGNLGTANLYRILGLRAGLLTLLGDVLKGALPVVVALYRPLPPGPWRDAAVAAVGAAAVLGHVFPVYLKFQGGKGVATAFGVVAVLSPWAALSLLLVYLAAITQTRIFSLSALICAWALPLAVGLFSPSKPYLILAGFLSALILLCHRQNLERLFKGEEPRV